MKDSFIQLYFEVIIIQALIILLDVVTIQDFGFQNDTGFKHSTIRH